MKTYEMSNAVRVKLSAKGQLVIPSAIRRKLGINPGSELRLGVDEDGKTIHMQPVERGDWRELRGILGGLDFDFAKMRSEDRKLELDHDEKKFGPFPRR